MTWSEVFQQIESYEFAARINIASSRKIFLLALSTDPAFHKLAEMIREAADSSDRVLKRIKSLTEMQFDYRYENPFDAALAAYAWALAKESIPSHARIAAELLISARQTWWAREVASMILEEVPASVSDAQTENRSIVASGFKSEGIRAIISSGSVCQSFLVSALLLQLNEFRVQKQLYKRINVLYSHVEDIEWNRQLGIWDKFSYATQMPQSIASIRQVEWSH